MSNLVIKDLYASVNGVQILKGINLELNTNEIHDFLIQAVLGHCNIIVAGETGSGKTEFVKYLASHTKVNEKIIYYQPLSLYDLVITSNTEVYDGMKVD